MDLKALMAKEQAAKKGITNAGPTASPAGDAVPTPAAKAPVKFGAAAPANAGQTAAASVDSSVGGQPAANAPAKGALAGFKFGGAGPAKGVASESGAAPVDGGKGADEGDQLEDSPADGSDSRLLPVPTGGAVFSVADIGSMDIDALGLSAAPNAGAFYRDQIPATLPDREIPEELDGDAKQFLDLLNGIYGIGFEPEHFGNMVRSIMSELATHPEYEQIMCDEDVHTLMKGMQQSMGMAAVKKAESKAKRAPKTPAQKQIGGAMASALAGLDDADFD